MYCNVGFSFSFILFKNLLSSKYFLPNFYFCLIFWFCSIFLLMFSDPSIFVIHFFLSFLSTSLSFYVPYPHSFLSLDLVLVVFLLADCHSKYCSNITRRSPETSWKILWKQLVLWCFQQEKCTEKLAGPRPQIMMLVNCPFLLFL